MRGAVRGARGAGADQGLGAALAAEHAAVYAYGVLAARTTGRLRVAMTTVYNAHRARRDQLRTMTIAAGGTPAEPKAVYELPATPSSAAQAVELAVLVEGEVRVGTGGIGSGGDALTATIDGGFLSVENDTVLVVAERVSLGGAGERAGAASGADGL